MKLVVVALLVAAVVAYDLNVEFDHFVAKYNKKYSSYELPHRQMVFRANLERARMLNQQNPSAEYGVNEFADLTHDEFKRLYHSKRLFSPEALATSCLANGVSAPRVSTEDLPTSWDWRTHNPPVVTPVKNQGQCGSCWAFSTTGNIEGQWALAGNPLTSLSEQALVDCSHACCMESGQQVCNSGCDGGWQWNAFTDVIAFGGLPSEAAYPYTALSGTCHNKGLPIVSSISNYTCFSGPDPADEDQMAANLVSGGPLSIAVNAEHFQLYHRGVMDSPFCNGKSLDHAILIVGYGVDGKNPYWIVKNSWGTSWGEDGYLMMARGKGLCGLNNAVSRSIVH